MRIAFFCEAFLPKVDGIVVTLCQLLEHLAKPGYQTLLFAPDNGESTRYAETPIVRLPAMANPLYPDLKFVWPFIDLQKELAAFRPDIVHLLNPVALGLVGLRHARRVNVPIVASYHTDLPGFAQQWGFGLFAKLFWNYYLRWIHNQADLNLCPSTFTLKQLRAQGFKRLNVWGGGVDTTRFHPEKRDAAWRMKLTDGQPDKKLLLYVGRLSPEKRIDWLKPVVNTFPDVRLAIVGDGPARSKLERQFANTSTVFTGYLLGDDLAHAYASADLFVFPSANETLGLVVLEAMASGLPVIAPRSGGLLDHVVNHKTGLLFDTYHQMALVSAVSHLLASPDDARQLGAAGRAWAERQRWPIVLDNLLQDYQSLLAL